ncbi:MAG: restriction endonuclease subunit S [Flavobacterium sp.]|uniref:restriction endonuclease subunit S n=1 Tax=Flavobacterium sp. TaxID=239 RepID=UPI001210EF8A|nr:restriction endonuclease subunit S [Flavobacterium sp.]RZJ66762.1 MAG: restriction endonuclease subunit S [Flavobacterium sp.]
MVNNNLAFKLQDVEEEVDYSFLPEPPKYTSVSLAEVFNNKLRLEASAFSIESKVAKDKVMNNRNGFVYAWSKDGFIQDCFYGGRAKRNYVSRNTDGAVGFIGSSEMLFVNPRPIKFLSSNVINVEQFKVKEGTILISRSGTIGNVTFVNKTLAKSLISEHAIRIIAKNNAGYMYAYFQTETGKTIVKSNTFGAVVDQIEPQHFEKIVIPNSPEPIKKEIHNLVVESYNLRDQSNELIDKAEQILYDELQLKPIEELQTKCFDNSVELRNYSTKLSNLRFRMEASFHVPSTSAILTAIKANAKEVTTLGDKRIASNIILPGRFKRVYVEKHNGIPFFGGKQLLELNPSNIKYLSLDQHLKRIGEQLFLKENMVAVTCSGTIGKVNIIPKHWENWTLNQHVMRIVPANLDIAGYIYCWLNTEFGYRLITRHTYGSVVDEIDDRHLSQVEIPLLKNHEKQKEINNLVLKANELRYVAHLKEQEAIEKMEKILLQVKTTF